METLKPNHHFLGGAALLVATCLIVPSLAGEIRGGSSHAASEASRRSVAVDEAQELLRKGDEAYTAGRYAEAVEAYAGARELIPIAPISAELRSAATERYAQAAVEQARLLSRNGDVVAAKSVLNKVLMDSVAPTHPGALAFLAQLDDPIRTNPALTKEHANDVDSVRRLLYTAEGAFNLGKFDQAKSTYEDVLRVDPTNSAARRGMEQVAVAKSDYQKSAYDHTRAELLNQVESQWELQVPALDIEPTLTEPGSITSDANFVSVKNKLDRIFIPKIALDQSSLDEALDFLRLRAGENDKLELDPARRGINFTVNLGPAESPAATRIRNLRFDLNLTQVPVSQVLKYITEVTQTSYTTDDFSVIISPLGSTSQELVTSTYRVPPDFIGSISNMAAQPAEAADPFATEPANRGLMVKRIGVQEALTQQGVSFSQGASANYMAATNTLRVVNTPTNQDFIAQIIDTLTKTEPVMVSVKVTMIKVEQTRLQELGFDWFLEGSGNDLVLGGGTQGNGRDAGDVAISPGGSVLNPITAGNRSGDFATSGNSIDSLIADQSDRQTRASAPGVLGVYGRFNDSFVQGMMRGLDQKKGVDIMAQPAVVTRSGQASSIAIIREFIYPAAYEPPELPNSVGSQAGTTPVSPAHPTEFKKEDVGVTLEVTPVVDADNRYINVTLNPTFSDFDGFVNYGSPINSSGGGLLGNQTVEITKNEILMPIFSKQRLSTSIDVADGSTVVLGGLMQESVQNVEDQTPVLGSIPIVGRLFQSTAKKPITKMVLFMVNVELMDPTGRRYRDR
jgi:general secretion pathway protein D